MESLLAIIIFIAIVIFIIKIGSILWRILGFVLLVAVIWYFHESILDQINQWLSSGDSDQLIESGKGLLGQMWDKIVAWFGSLAS